VLKKAEIFEAIMSTKSRIMKNQDLVCGVVEKWCSETNTFVFPFSSLFPITVLLARGNPIALAPPVLACLYKDLSFLKVTIVDLKKCPLVFEVNVQSPFYLVQVWVWERFPNLQPHPKLINYGDPVLLRL
jgi:hypothetical protein